MRKHLFHFLQLAVTLVVLTWIFRDPGLRAGMGKALSQADPVWILAGIVVAGLDEIANIIRWGLFLRIQGVRISWRETTAIFMIGVFFNLFLFGIMGGDAIKAYYLTKTHRKTAVFLSLVADRLIGLVVLIVFTLVLVCFRWEWLSQTPVAASLLYFLMIFTICSSLVLGASVVVTRFGWLQWLPKRTPGRAKILEIGAAYNLFSHHWKSSLIALALSVHVLFTYFGTFYCAARAFDAPLSLADVSSIMPVVTVISSVPISFSGLGVREQLFQTLLGDLGGLDGELSVLISLTGFLIYVVWSLVGAVIYLKMRRPGE